MSENLSKQRRIEIAKSRTVKVVDHLLYLLELHANNACVVYSPLLSSQIPTSYAANAFNVFQRSMHRAPDWGMRTPRLTSLNPQTDLETRADAMAAFKEAWQNRASGEGNGN